MIKVIQGNLLEQKADAIVNPANSWHIMGGGVAGQIKRHGGAWIENEAMQQGQTAIGSAIITSAGKLPAEYVIHAPTMKRPAERTSTDSIFLATLASLEIAKKHGLKTIAFPCMGAGVGRVPPALAAKAMVKAINQARGSLQVTLVAVTDEAEQAFKKALADEDNN